MDKLPPIDIVLDPEMAARARKAFDRDHEGAVVGSIVTKGRMVRFHPYLRPSPSLWPVWDDGWKLLAEVLFCRGCREMYAAPTTERRPRLSKRRRYCSDRCRMRVERRAAQREIEFEGCAAPMCTELVMPPRRYCSDACRQRAYRERKAAPEPPLPSRVLMNVEAAQKAVHKAHRREATLAEIARIACTTEAIAAKALAELRARGWIAA
jgi:hypothetical protein